MINVLLRGENVTRDEKDRNQKERDTNRLPAGSVSEVGFVLLYLHHEVVQVDELGAHGQAAERRLVQDLVEAVVVLDELGESALQREEEVERGDFTTPTFTAGDVCTSCFQPQLGNRVFGGELFL